MGGVTRGRGNCQKEEVLILYAFGRDDIKTENHPHLYVIIWDFIRTQSQKWSSVEWISVINIHRFL